MKTYNVEVHENSSKLIKIKAENERDAEEKVSKMYYDEKIILDYNDFNNVEFNILCHDDE